MSDKSTISDSEDEGHSTNPMGRDVSNRTMIYPLHPLNLEDAQQWLIARKVVAKAVAVEITKVPPAELRKYVDLGGSGAITEVLSALTIDGQVMFDIAFDDMHTEMVSSSYCYL